MQSFWGKGAGKAKSCSKTTTTSGQGAAACQKVNRGAVNVYPHIVCPYWSQIHAILTVCNNPIDTWATVPTPEEIWRANLILILPTAAYSILLWGAGGLYYLLEFWGKKGEGIIPTSSFTFSWEHCYNDRYCYPIIFPEKGQKGLQVVSQTAVI